MVTRACSLLYVIRVKGKAILLELDNGCVYLSVGASVLLPLTVQLVIESLVQPLQNLGRVLRR